MIVRLSNYILRYLMKSEVIDEEYSDFYKYGIEITLSSILNVVLVLIIGFIFSSLVESLVFLAVFISIRQFTGGFHASTYLGCNTALCIISTLVIVLSIFTYNLISVYAAIAFSVICIVIIIINCPVENTNKPIPRERQWVHRLIATILGVLYGAVGVILILFRNCCGAVVLYTLCAVAVLIILAIIKDWRCNNEENKQNRCRN